MLKRHQRLRRKRDFKRAYKKGRAVPGKCVVLFVYRKGKGSTRFGFSVSKRVGKAVVRNRVKRILREICRKNSHRVLSGYDIVLIAKKGINEHNYHTVEKDVLHLFRRSDVLKEK